MHKFQFTITNLLKCLFFSGILLFEGGCRCPIPTREKEGNNYDEALRHFCTQVKCAKSEALLCSDHFYFGYKPFMRLEKDPFSGIPTMKFYWQVCNWQYQDYSSFKDDVFVPFNNYDNTIVRGPGAVYPWDKNIPIDQYEGLVLVNLGQYRNKKPNESLIFYEDPAEVFGAFNSSGVELYASYKNLAILFDANNPMDLTDKVNNPGGHLCSYDFHCLSEDVQKQSLNCDFENSNGSIITCPNISSPCTTDNLIDVSSKYNNDIIYPAIRISHANQNQNNIADYVIDINKDINKKIVISTTPPKETPINRFVYANVIIKENVNNKYIASIKKDGTEIESIRLDGSTDERIRYCGDITGGGRKYVIKFILTGPGLYSLSLFNRDIPLASMVGSFTPVGSSCDFVVSSVDNYIDDKNFNSEKTNRELQLIALDFLIPDKIKCIADCKIDAFPSSFSDALNDAFSLNQKKTDTEKTTSLVNSIDFNISKCSAASSYINKSGNLTLNVEEILRYRNDPNLNLSLQDCYYQVISDVYTDFFNNYYGDCSPPTNGQDLTKGIIFYANWFDLMDNDGNIISTGEGEKAIGYDDSDDITKYASSPNEQFIITNGNTTSALLGKTGPIDFQDPYSENNFALKLSSVSGVFKKGHINQFGLNNSDKYAVISMVHELGHLYAQDNITYPTENSTDAHNHYCSGYNSKMCVFRYGDQQTYYPLHNLYGITWCENHRQILFNQLLRK